MLPGEFFVFTAVKSDSETARFQVALYLSRLHNQFMQRSLLAENFPQGAITDRIIHLRQRFQEMFNIQIGRLFPLNESPIPPEIATSLNDDIREMYVIEEEIFYLVTHGHN